MFKAGKYRKFPVMQYNDRRWPSAEIKKAPVWCSVDLRDGNQALTEPMNVAEKLRLFRILCERLGLDPAVVYKTLVTVGHSGRNYVFVIPVARELDLKKAASAAGEKKIEMLKLL